MDERRSVGAFDPASTVAMQRDRGGLQSLEFFFTFQQAAIFRTWWNNDLIMGASWFQADWPIPQGQASGVRRFINQPRWAFMASKGWRVNVVCEVMGRGLLPTQTMNVALLMFFQGADGDTSGSGFVDYSLNAATATRFAGSPTGATIETDFGGAIPDHSSSIYFPNSHNTPTASGLLFPSIPAYELRGDNFCIEYFTYFPSNPNAATEFQIMKAGSTNIGDGGSWWVIFSHLNSRLIFGCVVGGERVELFVDLISPYDFGVWNAVCIERYNGFVHFYVNGILQGKTAFTQVIDDSSFALTVGCMNFPGYGPTESLSGYMGMLRLTTQLAPGVSRYAGASSYSVTTTEFPRP